MVKKVSLKVNGEEIALNPFVRDIVRNVVLGMVDSLDKIPESIKSVELNIEEEDEK